MTWLDWQRLHTHGSTYRFFEKMIGFRKAHPTLARSLFWRDDVKWYGIGPDVDCSYDSHSIAFFLDGRAQRDSDLYVMINGYWKELPFIIDHGDAKDWRRVVDTGLASPQDFVDLSDSDLLANSSYTLGPRSIAVFVRDILGNAAA